MNNMALLVIISFFILISYIVATVWRWGLPWSISQTYFDIKRKYIFTLVMYLSFGLLLIPLLETLPRGWEIIGFLTCISGFFIGAAPNLEEKMQNKVHMTGALVLGICSQVCVGMLCPRLLILWSWLGIPLFIGRKHFVFWIEVVGGCLLYTAIIYALFGQLFNLNQ